MVNRTNKVRVPWFQPLSVVRGALRVFDGTPKTLVDDLTKQLHAQRGTPKKQVDWTNPDEWIEERLAGDEAKLARRLWSESEHVVNPRWLAGPTALIRIYELAKVDSTGVYRSTELGRAFTAEEPDAVRRIDEGEGMIRILSILSTTPKAQTRELLPEWGRYLRENSPFQADSSIRDALQRRLADLKDRGMIARTGNTYSITQAGADCLASGPDPDPAQAALRAIQTYNDDQREALRERLQTMNPYKFEQLVGDLLAAMGYEEVVVTKQSGDKGVDVVATVQFGITTITEVVQVKRHQGNISRHVIDQLRGALPYHEAIRGTIITTGSFSQGCKEAALFIGAAPIGLIDGDRLLDLLIEHKIGMRERPATLYEIDESAFEEPTESEDQEVKDADT